MKQGQEPNFKIVYLKFEPLTAKKIRYERKFFAKSLLQVIYKLELSNVKLEDVLLILNIDATNNFHQDNFKL
jgi:hypothetical protein